MKETKDVINNLKAITMAAVLIMMLGCEEVNTETQVNTSDAQITSTSDIETTTNQKNVEEIVEEPQLARTEEKTKPKTLHYYLPEQGLFISKSNNLNDIYFKKEEGYLVLAVDEDFNEVVAMMQAVESGVFYGGGFEFKLKYRKETDQEFILRVGKLEVSHADKANLSEKEYLAKALKLGKEEFDYLAGSKYHSNDSKTKPGENHYEDIIVGAVFIAADGIFKFDLAN